MSNFLTVAGRIAADAQVGDLAEYLRLVALLRFHNTLRFKPVPKLALSKFLTAGLLQTLLAASNFLRNLRKSFAGMKVA